MRLLLDTHVWLWLQYDPHRLGEAIAPVTDPDNDLLFSAASSWEIAIKWALGKLPLPEPPETWVPKRVATSGVELLAVEHVHALGVASLPRHHRDPFDRLLVVQAIAERAAIVTADPAMGRYAAEILWAG